MSGYQRMVLNARNILSGIAVTVLVFWITLYTSEERWEVEVEGQSLESPRIQRSVVADKSTPRKPNLTSSDREFLRSFGVANLRKTFKPQFSKNEKAEIMEALHLLTNALDVAGIDYFLYGGSLIGSWRHHDIVPWDDDLDIMVNISSWETLEALRIPGHTLNTRTLNRYKFYNNNATDIRFWKWPFIDICLFGDNGTHIYDIDPAFSKTFIFNKKDIFPLVRRPFGNLNLKAPKNSELVLRTNYNIDTCQGQSYNHRKEKVIPQKEVTTVDCKMLHRIYPFVIRDNDSDERIENVYLDDKLLARVDVHSINL